MESVAPVDEVVLGLARLQRVGVDVASPEHRSFQNAVDYEPVLAATEVV